MMCGHLMLMVLLQIGHKFSYSGQLAGVCWCWCNVEALHEATFFLAVFLPSSTCQTLQN
jgi:hypothetical protein